MKASPKMVPAFYNGKNVMITGVTGFVGKVLLEKILRSLPGIEQIYVLIRLKPGKTIRGRLESEVLSSKIFDRLVSKNFGGDTEEFFRYANMKITPIAGDMIGHRNNLDIQKAASTRLLKKVVLILFSTARRLLILQKGLTSLWTSTFLVR